MTASENIPAIKPTKAGIILYGWVVGRDGRRRLHVLSPYTEGRFCTEDKCYTLAKGAIDPGENPLQGAVRETVEETGFDLRKLMGEEAYTRFAAGEVIKDLQSDGYRGVSVVKADPVPILHRYTSGHGTQHDAEYFAIEVDGIERLKPFLKRMGEKESDANPKVLKTAKTYVKEKHLPDFLQMLAILRSGQTLKRSELPEGKRQVGWADNIAYRLIFNPVLPALELQYNMVNINNVRDWVKFCTIIDGKEYKKLKEDIAEVKRYFELRDMVGDSGKKLKLDSKDRPLTFYQEGAEILPVEVMLARSVAVAAKNPLYAKAMWGDYKGKRRHDANERVRMASAQIAPLVELFANISPMAVAMAGVDGGLVSRGEGVSNRGGEVAKPAPWLNKHIKRAVDLFAEPVLASNSFLSRLQQSDAVKSAAER